ncbi:MAG: bifunctional aspartate kinase/homoserine dehydrogenase I [Bacteroidota bacterium]
MKVLKFGGTSVASAEHIIKVKDIILKQPEEYQTVVVVSALGGITNLLTSAAEMSEAADEGYEKILEDIEARHIELCKSLLPLTSQSKTLSQVKIMLNTLEDVLKGVFLVRELSLKTRDYIQGFGERLSALIISRYLEALKVEVGLADPQQFIFTDTNYGNGNVDFELTYPKTRDYFKKAEQLVICPGFIASTTEGHPITLGRGGSDYTAALIAAALNADSIEIWTDVDGMLTANPKLVRLAHSIEEITYEEAMELSHFGAKVIYPPTIQPALEKAIPISIKNTFNPGNAGTLISKEAKSNGHVIKGLSSVQHVALINLTGSGMVGVPNFSFRLFRTLSEIQVNVILITQASSEHSICVGIDGNDIEKSVKALNQEFSDEMNLHKLDPLGIETGLSIVALVGVNMKKQVGVSGKLFKTLGTNGVNIKAIAQGSSELNISVVIENKDLKKSLNALHESFFLSDMKKLNLFIIGVGNVGGTFIGQLAAQREYLAKEHHLDIRVVAVANSRKMYFDDQGMDLNQWKDLLEKQGSEMDNALFIEKMRALNYRNSIFIDNTASENIAGLYDHILSHCISVVTPNKIACSSDYEGYTKLKSLTKKFNARFLFETNVGAGLPVISTLNDLIKSGDKIHKIEAVLSGSLNFVFNQFNDKVPFSEVVHKAQEEGYTEPDPRIDLSGVDVMRKILILIRESGKVMNLEDIDNRSFLPEACQDTESVDEFYKKLEEHEVYFQEMYAKAAAENKKLKYVASFVDGQAFTSLQAIDDTHPFYHLEGKDNIVVFYTERYTEQPLIVKGAGAGAAVTASGIFADVMRLGHS